MSHELEIDRDGLASMAYNSRNGQPWWERMGIAEGVATDGYATIDDMLDLSRADYEVWLEPMTSDVIRDSGVYSVPINDHFAVMRDRVPGEDPDEPFNMGVVGNIFTVVQNRGLGEWAIEMLGEQSDVARVDTMMVLLDGRMFVIYIDVADLVIDKGGINDRIKLGLSIMQRHDGKMAITAAVTPVRAVCMNTTIWGLSSAVTKVTIRHTQNLEFSMVDARRALGMTVSSVDQIAAGSEALLRINATVGSLDRVVSGLWPKADADTDRKRTIWENRMIKIAYCFEREAQDFGANGYSLANAVGEYLDYHARGNDESMMVKRLSGTANDMKSKAEALVLA